MLLLVVSFRIVSFYAKRKKKPPTEVGGDATSAAAAVPSAYFYWRIDWTSMRLSFWLCVLSLAVSLGAMLLVPVTILVSEILAQFPSVVAVDGEVVFGYWTAVFLGSYLALFGVVPYAYFYYEAAGLGTSRRAKSRFYEATIVVCLMSVLFYLFFYVLRMVVRMDELPFLQFTFLIVSLAGSIVLGAAAPSGYSALLAYAFSLRRPLHRQQFVEDRVNTLTFELQALEQRARRLEEGAVEEEIARVRAEREEMARFRNSGAILGNLLFLVTLAITVSAPVYTLLRIVMRVLGIRVNALFYARPVVDAAAHAGRSELTMQLVRNAPGVLFSSIEIALASYFMLSAIVGIYTSELRFARRVRPRRLATPIPLLLANVAIWLVLSVSLPVVTRMLGITSFNLLGYFSHSETVDVLAWGKLPYRLVFLVVFGLRTVLRLVRTADAILEYLRAWWRSLHEEAREQGHPIMRRARPMPSVFQTPRPPPGRMAALRARKTPAAGV